MQIKVEIHGNFFSKLCRREKTSTFWAHNKYTRKMSLMHIFVVKMLFLIYFLIYLFDSGKLPEDNIFNIYHCFNIHN